MFCRILSRRAFSTFRILPRMGRMACVARSRALLALPPALLPSTMYSSHDGGVAELAVGQLARQRPGLQEGLAPGEVARLARGDAGLGGAGRLGEDALGVAGVLFEPGGELRVDRGLDQRSHGGVPQLGLGLTLELRVAELDRQDRDEALANVFADQVVFLLLEQALGARPAVEHVGEGLLEPLLVHAALVGVDRVGERVQRLGVGGGPLHRELDLTVVGGAGLDRDDLVDRRPCPGRGTSRSRRDHRWP